MFRSFLFRALSLISDLMRWASVVWNRVANRLFELPRLSSPDITHQKRFDSREAI